MRPCQGRERGPTPLTRSKIISSITCFFGGICVKKAGRKELLYENSNYASFRQDNSDIAHVISDSSENEYEDREN